MNQKPAFRRYLESDGAAPFPAQLEQREADRAATARTALREIRPEHQLHMKALAARARGAIHALLKELDEMDAAAGVTLFPSDARLLTDAEMALIRIGRQFDPET